MKKDKKELIEINIGTIIHLPSWERAKIINERHIWLEKERRNDKKELYRDYNKRYEFLNKEKMKEIRRKWHLKKLERIGKIPRIKLTKDQKIERDRIRGLIYYHQHKAKRDE